MNGSELLVAQLKAEGVDVVFGIPGIHLMHVLDALHGEPSIRFITTRHEQATTYMADGYSRVTGRPGVAMVVPGPGVYNAASGLATAWACSWRVVMKRIDGSPWRASRTCMRWMPGMPKTTSVPSRTSCWTRAVAPDRSRCSMGSFALRLTADGPRAAGTSPRS